MTALHKRDVEIPVTETLLRGALVAPAGAETFVIFSNDSGWNSRENEIFTQRCQQHNIATMAVDLLTGNEDRDYYNRFNIELLAGRLLAATKWLMEQDEARKCRIGYFGTDTGAAAALKAASVFPQISAIVSCSGRPDLAMDVLQKVTTPVLLIAGSLDYDVLQLNEVAYAFLRCEKALAVIDGAGHLFEEGNTLGETAGQAVEWFDKYLVRAESVRNVHF